MRPRVLFSETARPSGDWRPTVGHADHIVVPPAAATTLADDGRFLEVVNGMILFGVSAAYVFELMQLYWSMLAKHVTLSEA
jgi:hypothetical protein